MNALITVNDLKERLGLELLAGEGSLDKEVKGCYIGDLLSWVMAKCKENDAWISVMGNINAIAVATLKDVACIILAENASLDEDAKKRADKQEIAVLLSSKNSFELALEIGEILKL